MQVVFQMCQSAAKKETTLGLQMFFPVWKSFSLLSVIPRKKKISINCVSFNCFILSCTHFYISTAKNSHFLSFFWSLLHELNFFHFLPLCFSSQLMLIFDRFQLMRVFISWWGNGSKQQGKVFSLNPLKLWQLFTNLQVQFKQGFFIIEDDVSIKTNKPSDQSNIPTGCYFLQ